MRGRSVVVAGVIPVLLSVFPQWLGGQTPTPAEPNMPTLFVIGDSTAKNGPDLGWGSHIGRYFDSTKISAVNRALGGRSSRTFQTEGFWDNVLGQLKPGDFVLIRFGHNDAGPVNDASRARGTIKGIGDQTEEIDNLLTGKHEIVHTYGWYLRKIIVDARSKGAVPIICSPIPRNNWEQGRVIRASESYGLWAAQVAQAEGTPFIDLNEIIARRYEQMGRTRVDSLCFPPGERTHTSTVGAQINAACVAEGLRSLADCPLQTYLRDARP